MGSASAFHGARDAKGSRPTNLAVLTCLINTDDDSIVNEHTLSELIEMACCSPQALLCTDDAYLAEKGPRQVGRAVGRAG